MAETEPLRYADPFFTVGAKQPPQPFADSLAEWKTKQLGPILPPRDPKSLYLLSDLIGQAAADEIQQAGSINFHTVGDTGDPSVHTQQDDVAQLMAADYTIGDDASNPAFFFHLGDVIYGPNKEAEYLDEFYRPYQNYPGKICAIPGNHDGEKLPPTDPDSLTAFWDNFCAPSQDPSPLAASVGIARTLVNQPGVYYLLRAPYVDIVCMYSNLGENYGSIGGENGDDSHKTWLAATLHGIATERADQGLRKALVFATHHPPYSNGGHGDNLDMLAEIDSACAEAQIQPDAFLSGHSHNYQHHTRYVGDAEIPFIVAGCGGHHIIPPRPANPGQKTGDHSYENSYGGLGYLRLTASATTLQIDFYALGQVKTPYESVPVQL